MNTTEWVTSPKIIYARLPGFLAAYRQGVFYRTEQVCDNLRRFHSAGMSITLKEYPGEDASRR